MKRKTTVIFTTVVILVSVAIGILVKGDFLNGFKEGEKYVKGMFPQEGSITIQDNQIYFNDEKMTTDSDKKSFPVLSPDKTRVAYYISDINNESIGILELKTKEIKKIRLENITFSSVNGLEWLNNSMIGFYAHVNPSLDVYCLLDANKLQKVKEYYGIGFAWDSRKENIYYALPQPHFSNMKGREKIYKNDQVIFETSDSESILKGPYISENNDIAFYTKDINAEDEVKLNIGKVKDEKIVINKRVKWEKETGAITFTDNSIQIRSDSGIKEYKIDDIK